MSELSEELGNYIRKEVERRTSYKIQLERHPPFLGYDEFARSRSEEQRQMLQTAMDSITDSIIKIAQKHMPSVEIDPNDLELSLSNILQAIPAQVVKKQYWLVSGRGGRGPSPS